MSASIFAIAILATVAILGGQAQRIVVGPCPDVTLQASFDLAKYMGAWYEIEASKSVFEKGFKCGTDTYTLAKDGNVTIAETGEKNGKKINMTERGVAVDGNAAHWSIIDPKIPISGDYEVLDTDYNTYSLVWSCKEIPLSAQEAASMGIKAHRYSINGANVVSQNGFKIHTELIFLLSRQRTLDKTLVDKLHKELDDRKLNRSTLEVTDQTGC